MKGWLVAVVVLVLLAFVGWFTVLPWFSVRLAAGRASTKAPPVLDPRKTFIMVLNSRRSAIRGAIVTIRRDDQAEPVAVVTMNEPMGAWFRLPDGEIDWSGLRVRAEVGPLSREVLLNGHPGAFLELELPATLPLMGRVVLKGTGAPVAGAQVRTGVGTVSADEDGRFQVAFAPDIQALDGSLRLEVVSAGKVLRSFQFPCTKAGSDLVLEVGD